MKKIAPFLLLGVLAALIVALGKSRRPQKVVRDMATVDISHPERTIDEVNEAMPMAGGIRL